ncbi:MAG: ABC transporter ATP-binding protein [Thermoplasmata archaeon]
MTPAPGIDRAGPAAPRRGLRVDRLSVVYGDRLAVREVTFSVGPGEVVALAGPNGSGKSSLIRAAVGLATRSGGHLEVEGVSDRFGNARDRARRVAWMPQDEAPGENVPLEEYVGYGRYAWTPRWALPSPADRAAVRRAIAELDLGPLASRGMAELSGGERQRARLARTLAQDAPVLLLDEPTAHLDIGHQLDLLERIRTHARREQRSVVVALHDLNLAARFMDRVAVLSHGRLVAIGPPADVLSPALLEEVWGILAELRQDPRTGQLYLLPRLAPGRETPRTAPPRRRVHLVAGGGSGSSVLKALFERGYDLSAGVLPLFDTDTELARELGLPIAIELPFAPIGPEALERLDRLLAEAGAIVVAAFPVGPTNLANLERLRDWTGRRPVALVEQPSGEAWDYTAGRASALREELIARGAVVLPSLEAILDWLAALPASSGA